MRISAIVPCIRQEDARTCKVLRGYGYDVICVGREGFMDDESAMKSVNSSDDEWTCWDVGIDLAEATGYDGFVLVGSGCVPQENIVRDHMVALDRHIPVISIGRCMESRHGWRDGRQVFGRDGVLVGNVSMVTGGMIACCNMGLNAPAVRRLRRLNESAHGISRCFPMDGYGHRLGYAAWLSHICMWYLPIGENSVKLLSRELYPSVPSDDQYINKLRETKISLEMLD